MRKALHVQRDAAVVEARVDKVLSVVTAHVDDDDAATARVVDVGGEPVRDLLRGELSVEAIIGVGNEREQCGLATAHDNSGDVAVPHRPNVDRDRAEFAGEGCQDF